MELAERITTNRKARKISQPKLAEAVGVSLMTVRRWEKGERVPDVNDARRLAAALGVDIAYLLEGDESKKTQVNGLESNVRIPNAAHLIRVRVLDKDFRACCGSGIDWGSEAVEFEQSMLLPLPDLAIRYSDGDVIATYAEGDSMDPKIKDGNMVLFVPREKEVMYAGIIMVVAYNNRMIIRGVVENNRKQITLKSINKNYSDIVVTPDDDFDICGKVVKVFSVSDPGVAL